jgi:competence ComEA-like helix-hairpin-helix protein
MDHLIPPLREIQKHVRRPMNGLQKPRDASPFRAAGREVMTAEERRLVIVVTLLILIGSAVRVLGLRAPLALGERVTGRAFDSLFTEESDTGGTAQSPSVAEREVGADPWPVDLNASDEVSLEALPGIGPTKARRIVAWREAHGPFRSLEDLEKVPGIGPKTIARLAPLLAPLAGGAPRHGGTNGSGAPAREQGKNDESRSRRDSAPSGDPERGAVPEGAEAEGVLGRPDG